LKTSKSGTHQEHFFNQSLALRFPKIANAAKAIASDSNDDATFWKSATLNPEALEKYGCKFFGMRIRIAMTRFTSKLKPLRIN